MESIKALIHTASGGKFFAAPPQNCSSLLHLGKVADFYTIMRCRQMPPDAVVNYGSAGAGAGDDFMYFDSTLGTLQLWKFLLVTLKLLIEIMQIFSYMALSAVIAYLLVVHMDGYREMRAKMKTLRIRKESYDTVKWCAANWRRNFCLLRWVWTYCKRVGAE